MAERKMKQNVKDAKVKTYMYWMMGLLVVLIGIAVLLPIVPADAPIWLGKVVTVTLMLLTEVILVMAYKLARYYYQGIFDKDAPLFVPKAIGIGFTINPYHRLGKYIWFVSCLPFS
ncbi:hypothetical protein [Enterococcus cecorum]|uniref:hypothetical protein n=1 Tax=Enterococcus cecorum TaxID=44008 RepID=UPI0032C46888